MNLGTHQLAKEKVKNYSPNHVVINTETPSTIYPVTLIFKNTSGKDFGDLFKRYKTNVSDAHKTHFRFHRCLKFILNNKAVVKKKAVSGEEHLQRFVFLFLFLTKYQTKAF